MLRFTKLCSSTHSAAIIVEAMIDDVFAAEVEQHVAYALEELLPTALQEQLVEQQGQLQEVQRSLHNSYAASCHILQFVEADPISARHVVPMVCFGTPQ